jgi:tripeptidyl-peptidase-1
MLSRISTSFTTYLQFACIFILFGSSSCLGWSSRSSYVLKERHHAPRSWSRVGRAPADHEIEIRIGLRQARFDELEQRLFEGEFSLNV